jgi:hypothetical protein
MHLKRRDFMRGIGAMASIGALDGRNLVAQAVLPTDPALAVQTILDGFVARNRTLGKTQAGIVVGAISPKLPHSKLFFGGSLISARNRRVPVPLDGDTPFLIGSITKCFSSLVFGLNGKSYEALLGDFVETPLPPGVSNLTMQTIANYSSGFPTDDVAPIWWSAMHPNDLDALIGGMAGKVLPQCEPGRFYSYSNFAWGLFGLAAVGVANVTTQAYRQWYAAMADLRAHVGLSPRTVPWSESVPLAAGYAQNDRLLSPSFAYGRASWATLFGSGDLVSTGNDMYAWMAYNMGRTSNADNALLRTQQAADFTWTQLAPPAQVGATFCQEPQQLAAPVRTALGWFRSNRFADPSVTVMTKNGGVAGYTSWIGFQSWVDSLQQSPVGVFALTNDGNHAADAIGRAVLNYLLQPA